MSQYADAVQIRRDRQAALGRLVEQYGEARALESKGIATPALVQIRRNELNSGIRALVAAARVESIDFPPPDSPDHVEALLQHISTLDDKQRSEILEALGERHIANMRKSMEHE